MIIFLSSSLLELIDNLAIKFQEVEDIAPSLAEVVGSEQMLLEECANLLHQALNMQVRFHQNKMNTLIGINSVLFNHSYVAICLAFYVMLRCTDGIRHSNCVGDGRQPEGTTLAPEKSRQRKNMKAISQ